MKQESRASFSGFALISRFFFFLTSAYPHIDMRFIAHLSTRPFHFFSFKDRILLRLRSHAVIIFLVEAAQLRLLVKPVGTYIHVCSNTWKFLYHLARNAQPFLPQASIPAIRKQVILFHLTISKFFFLLLRIRTPHL